MDLFLEEFSTKNERERESFRKSERAFQRKKERSVRVDERHCEREKGMKN